MVRRRVHYFWMMWVGAGVITAGVLAGGAYYAVQALSPDLGPARASAEEQGEGTEAPPALHVEVVRPRKGGLDHTTTQPGTVQPFESARLFAEATGYLKKQTVDIGDRVKKGQVLAQIDVPELVTQVERNQAGLQRANALVTQMESRVTSARAELDEAKAEVVEAQANARSKAAALRYRESVYARMKKLAQERSIEGKVVDEEREHRDAALEAKNAAEAAVVTTNAKVTAATARIDRARADVDEARAEVKVNKAELDRSKVLVSFATITSPYDGVITQRNFFRGDFVRSAADGSTTPLLRVERTDKFRVVVLVPDRDVPFVDVGDPAVVEIDALPGKRFQAKVSRKATSEDPQTRLMRVEVDLPNEDGRTQAGMFGRVTIILDHSDLLTLPTSCVINRNPEGKGEAFVVRGGRLHRQVVRTGSDNGILVAILRGVKADDQVVLHPSAGMEEGEGVTASPAELPGRGALGAER